MKKFLLYSTFMVLPLLSISQNLQIRVISLLNEERLDSIVVHLLNDKTGEERIATTDAEGIASFPMPSNNDSHTIFTLEEKGYQPLALSGIKPGSASRMEYTLRLPSSRTEMLGEVLISSVSMAKINTQNATVYGQLKKEELRRLPIEGRDITRGLSKLPNVTISVLSYPEAPNISINGLNGIFTNYLIDGLDNNERFLGNMKLNTPAGFVENVTVLTNNFSAEWGNTSNGVVNVLTKSGTNELTGEVFYLTRPGSVIDSKSDFATLDLYGNPVKDGFQRHQAGFGVGGSLKKDKTFFYINAEQTIDIKDNLLNSPELGVNETIRGNNYFTYVSGKVDHIWSSRWRSSLRGQVGRMYLDRQGGGLEGGINFPSSASAQDNETYLLAFRNILTVNSRLSAEFNYLNSYFRWNYREPVNITSPSVTVRDPANIPIAILGQSGSIFDDKEYTNQVQAKLFYNLGNHSIKAGVEAITSDFQLIGGGNPFGTYTVRLDQAELDYVNGLGLGSNLQVTDIPTTVDVTAYDVELQSKAFGARQNTIGIYVEDTYQVTERLTANAGIRWDYDNLTKSGGNEADLNNIAPRLSLNYDLGNRSVIRGGYGIYYDKIKYSVYSDALQFSSTSSDFKAQLAELQRLGLLSADADLDQITFDGNIRATASDVQYLQGPTADELSDNRENIFSNNLRILNPDGWQNPYSHQFSLGFQHKPSDETIFIIDAVHTRTNNLYVIRNLNAASSYTFAPGTDPEDVVVRTPTEGDLSRPIPIYPGNYSVVNGDTLRGGSRNVFMTETAGKARYTALNFMLQKEISGTKLAYRILYTLSYTKSNTSSINFRAQDNNDFEAEYNWDENDRRHVMSASLFWEPLKRLFVTPSVLIQSGQPATRLADATVFGTADLNGDREAGSDRWPGELKNADRLPWATTFDFSVKYVFEFKNSTGVELSADIFNLLDAQNWSGYNVSRAASNQNQIGPPNSNNYQITSLSPPRQFQFGARYIF